MSRKLPDGSQNTQKRGSRGSRLKNWTAGAKREALQYVSSSHGIQLTSDLQNRLLANQQLHLNLETARSDLSRQLTKLIPLDLKHRLQCRVAQLLRLHSPNHQFSDHCVIVRGLQKSSNKPCFISALGKVVAMWLRSEWPEVSFASKRRWKTLPLQISGVSGYQADSRSQQ